MRTGLMGEEMWNTTRCATHDIEYHGCFCPDCFMPNRPARSEVGNVNIRMTFASGAGSDCKVEKFVDGVWVEEK